MGKQWQTLFFEAPKSLQIVTAAMKLKDSCSLEENLTNLDIILKSRRYFADRGPSGISSSHVWMWELDYKHKESWVPKNWYFRTVVLEKTLESPLDCKEIKPVNRKGNQSWIFTEKTDAEAETPKLWPPDAKNWLIWKDPDADVKIIMLNSKTWRGKKGTTEDEMIEWHHWLDGHEFEQALGAGDGQGSLACCSPWGCSQTQLSDWTEPLFDMLFIVATK